MDLEDSIVKQLFVANILSGNLMPFHKFEEEEAETVQMIMDSIDKFSEGLEENFRAWDKAGDYPSDFIESVKELGLFGLIIPEEYGGIGLSNAAYSRVLGQASRHDASLALTIGAHSSIGMKGLLLYGNETQKQKYLPKLATGEYIAAFCLTEPGSGSDAASIKTSAEKNSDGSWVINGEKIWITNGGIADYFTVFARTDTQEAGRLTAFIVERSFAGLSTGVKEDKLGIRASSTTTVTLANVRVPAENVLGEPGEGFKIAMGILNNGRTGLGGGCVGAMKRCIALATKQAKDRKQFGRSISQFGLIREKISKMTLNCFASESVVQTVAGLIDSGCKDYSTEAAISKVFATEALWQTVNEALQVAGGNGFMKEFPYEKVLRDSRINMIFEGTSEILRLFIALSGVKHAGKVLRDLQKSATRFYLNPIKAGQDISKYFKIRLAMLVPDFRPKLKGIHPCLKENASILETRTAQLAVYTERLLREHGREIVHEQMLLKRISEVAIHLFVGYSMISRVQALIDEKGPKAAETELALLNLFCKEANRVMTSNFRRVYTNEDANSNLVASHILEAEHYPWDVLK